MQPMQHGHDVLAIAACDMLARKIVAASDANDSDAKRACVLDFRAMSDWQKDETRKTLARLFQGSNLNIWA